MNPTKPQWLKDALAGKPVRINGKTIFGCEVVIEGVCYGMWPLTPMHRHKRLDYRKQPEKLWDFNEVVVACQPCHHYTETKQELTEECFKRLRGALQIL